MSLIDADTGEVVDVDPSTKLSQLEHTGLAVKVGTAPGTHSTPEGEPPCST